MLLSIFPSSLSITSLHFHFRFIFTFLEVSFSSSKDKFSGPLFLNNLFREVPLYLGVHMLPFEQSLDRGFNSIKYFIRYYSHISIYIHISKDYLSSVVYLVNNICKYSTCVQKGVFRSIIPLLLLNLLL
jgi:hypothetical protein